MTKRGTKNRSVSARLKWGMLGLAVLVGLFGLGLARETLRSRQIDKEIAELEAEAESLRAKNFEITHLTASLDDEEFLEREARLKLGLKKVGEEVVVLKKDGSTSGVRRVLGAETDAYDEWTTSKKWWMYFADRRTYDDYAVRRGYR